MKIHLVVLLSLARLISTSTDSREVYLVENGHIQFRSYAPLEVIEASSNELKGAIDINKRTFAFTVGVKSFEGFNNPLQKEHFKENYLESDDYPTASFLGRIIEKTDLTQDGEYTLRAKGELKIHGVTQERIIKSIAIVQNGQLSIEANFSVLLNEHDITIPRIVWQKIAEEIQVHVKADFALSSS